MEEYKIQVACKQVSVILDCYNQELLSLSIPKEVLDNLKENSAKDYEYHINPDTFDVNTLTEEALALLLILYNEYFATKTQKRKIDMFLNPQNYTEYDYSKLFKKTKESSTNDKQLIVYHEQNIIKKIIQKLKQIFLR